MEGVMIQTKERSRAHMTFLIRDVHCAHCAATLRVTIESLPGVLSVEVDPFVGRTRLTYDPDVVSAADLLDAVEASGCEIVRTWD
jgi:copper chaperone CopZ